MDADGRANAKMASRLRTGGGRESASAPAAFDFRAALIQQVQAALVACVGPTLSPKAVHDCRVHLKRARALARLGRYSAPGLAKVFNDAARAVMIGLSHDRDLAALAAASRTLARACGKRTRLALETCAATLDQERRALPPINTDHVRKHIRDLQALAQVWPECTSAHVVKGVNRILRRARTAYREARRAEDPDHRHAWRKREKDRLYSVELLGEHWPRGLRRRFKANLALGDLLGQEREVMLLVDKLRHNRDMAGGEEAAARAIETCETRLRGLRKRARRLGARLHHGGA
jgi:hypothetical protein